MLDYDTVKLIFLLAGIAVSTPALADWQYTKWGMNSAQVVLASKGKARLATASSQLPTKGAEGSYTSGVRNFMVDFFFTDSKLDNVTLHSQPGDDCYSLRNDLIGLYGKPIEEKDGMLKVARWRDIKKGNLINWNMVADTYCAIEYTPLAGSNAAGL